MECVGGRRRLTSKGLSRRTGKSPGKSGGGGKDGRRTNGDAAEARLIARHNDGNIPALYSS